MFKDVLRSLFYEIMSDNLACTVTDAVPQAYFTEILSLSGRMWTYHPCQDTKRIHAIATTFNIPPYVVDIMMQRGLCDDEQIENFLNPRLKNLLFDPFALKNMHEGVTAVYHAIQGRETIGVLGDYDVDGATSTALLYRYFQAIGIESRVHIPDRLREGYGPNREALKAFYDQGIRCVIIVDCGTLSFDPLAYAKQLGLNIIVIDHHLSADHMPDVTALINPNRRDEYDNPNLPSYARHLCAAGMVFVFLVGLQKYLRDHDFFHSGNDGIYEPDLFAYLDLVALGTVCDVMPLTHLNRAFVAQGLCKIQSAHNMGLRTLMDVVGCAYNTVRAHHLGFVIGPRINAGGRVGESSMGTRLLSHSCMQSAHDLSLRLDAFNQERQEIERQMLSEAYAMVEEHDLHTKSVIIIASDMWHPGVIGIAASRLKDRYQKPVIVVSFQNDPKVGKGSGRSIPGVSLGDILQQAVNANLLLQGGGHAMAAGLTVARDQLNAFSEFMWKHTHDDVAAYTPTLTVSGVVTIADVHVGYVEGLSQLEPFGQGNPAPKFVMGPVRIIQADVIGGMHLRLSLIDHTGHCIKSMYFKAMSMPYVGMLVPGESRFYILGTLKKDTWRGRESCGFYIDDIMQISS